MNSGYTLIELMVVVAIVGILTTLAVPQYQDYAVRAKLSEGLQALGAARTTLAEYALSEGAFPEAAGDTLGTTQTRFVAGLEYGRDGDAGVLSAQIRNTGSEADERYVSLVGEIAAGAVVWRCRGGDAAGAESRAVPERYLPGACRRGDTV
jgi:type IV pilus assembly protein PilA